MGTKAMAQTSLYTLLKAWEDSSLFHIYDEPLGGVAVDVHLDILPHRLVHHLALAGEKTECGREHLAWPEFSAVQTLQWKHK